MTSVVINYQNLPIMLIIMLKIIPKIMLKIMLISLLKVLLKMEERVVKDVIILVGTVLLHIKCCF